MRLKKFICIAKRVNYEAKLYPVNEFYMKNRKSSTFS
jgi:hypothetical protein